MKLTNITEIKALLARHGFHFSKALGQNFLVADWVPRQIAESAGLDEQTGVLEIGPGIGCLTAELSQRAGKVLAVELDKSLAPVLAETLEGRDNVELLFGDVLRQDLSALVAEKLDGLRPVVCANLPYNVTTPVLTALLDVGCFSQITVMIQREVARRLCARAGTADYGAFTLFVQWRAEVEQLFDVPPGCFLPQPKVTSTVIRLTPRQAPPVEVRDPELLFKLIRAAFNQRRKTLVNAMASGLGLPKAEGEAILVRCGYDPRIRGEALDLGGFARIADEIVNKEFTDL